MGVRRCRMHGAEERRQLYVETHLKRNKEGKRGVEAGREEGGGCCFIGQLVKQQ